MRLQLQLQFIVLGVFLIPLIVSACKPTTSEEGAWKEASEVGLSEIPQQYLNGSDDSMVLLEQNRYDYDIQLPETIQPASIASMPAKARLSHSEPLEITQARFAAHQQDKCPKLVATEVDSNEVIRTKEILRKDMCDYFIFANKGDRISVDIKPDDFRAFLISPLSHDFLEGSFIARSHDKYVIRVKRKGSVYGNSDNKYGITFDIAKSKK